MDHKFLYTRCSLSMLERYWEPESSHDVFRRLKTLCRWPVWQMSWISCTSASVRKSHSQSYPKLEIAGPLLQYLPTCFPNVFSPAMVHRREPSSKVLEPRCRAWAAQEFGEGSRGPRKSLEKSGNKLRVQMERLEVLDSWECRTNGRNMQKHTD